MWIHRSYETTPVAGKSSDENRNETGARCLEPMSIRADSTDQASPSNHLPPTSGAFCVPMPANPFATSARTEFQDSALIPFSRFGGSLLIDADAGIFYLSGGFTLGRVAVSILPLSR